MSFIFVLFHLSVKQNHNFFINLHKFVFVLFIGVMWLHGEHSHHWQPNDHIALQRYHQTRYSEKTAWRRPAFPKKPITARGFNSGVPGAIPRQNTTPVQRDHQTASTPVLEEFLWIPFHTLGIIKLFPFGWKQKDERKTKWLICWMKGRYFWLCVWNGQSNDHMLFILDLDLHCFVADWSTFHCNIYTLIEVCKLKTKVLFWGYVSTSIA